MQQPKNPDSARDRFTSIDKGERLKIILQFFQDEFNEQNPRYAAAADKDSFRAGFAEGVETASLGMLAVVLDLVTSGEKAGECFVQILDMLETVHYAGHVLRGGKPRCVAVERLFEETAIKASVIEELLAIREAIRSTINTASQKPPSTVN